MVAENTNFITFSLYYQLLKAGVPSNNSFGNFETFTEIPLRSRCYLHNTLDYSINSSINHSMIRFSRPSSKGNNS